MRIVGSITDGIEEWLDDTKSQRKLKAGVVAAFRTYAPVMTVTTVFTTFIGSFGDANFPHVAFWLVVLVTACVTWNYFKEKALKEKYTTPRMIDHVSLNGSLVFYFRNRKDLKEYTIVEIRRVVNKSSQPYAIGYVNRQDDANKKRVIVYPLAFARGSKYIKLDPHPSFEGKNSEYFLCIGPMRKDVYDCLSVGGGYEYGKD